MKPANIVHTWSILTDRSYHSPMELGGSKTETKVKEQSSLTFPAQLCVVHWRWSQHFPLKCWYIFTRLHRRTFQKTVPSEPQSHILYEPKVLQCGKLFFNTCLSTSDIIPTLHNSGNFSLVLNMQMITHNSVTLQAIPPICLQYASFCTSNFPCWVCI